MTTKLIKLFLALLLFLAPFGLILRFKIIDNVYLLPQDVVVAILALLVWCFCLWKRKLPQQKKLLIATVLFLGFGVFSALVNFFLIPHYNLVVSLLYPLRYFMYFSLLFIPQIIGYGYKKWVYISGTIVIFLGLVQHLFYKDLGNLSYLGWDNHLYRLFSTFLDPNFAGAFFVLFLFFSISFALRKTKGGISKKYFPILVSLVSFISIFLTYSRTSLIMLIVGACVFFILIKKIKLLVGFFGIMLILLFVVSDVTIEGLNPFRTASSNERLKSAGQAASVAIKNPIMGVGFNGYRYAQIHYGLRSEEGAKTSNADAGTDNSYLFVLATTGLIGFSLFAYFSYLFVQAIERKYQEGKLIFSLVIAISVGSIFLNILFYTPLLLWFYLIVGGSLRGVKAGK